MSIKKCRRFNYNCPYYDDNTAFCLDTDNKSNCYSRIDLKSQLTHEEIAIELVKHLKRIEKQNFDLLKRLQQKQK